MKIGYLEIKWNRPEPRITPSVWIVCRDESHRAAVQCYIGTNPHVRVVSPTISDLYGGVPQTVIIASDVDVGRNVRGEGRLIDLLRRRQITFGRDAGMVQL